MASTAQESYTSSVFPAYVERSRAAKLQDPFLLDPVVGETHDLLPPGMRFGEAVALNDAAMVLESASDGAQNRAFVYGLSNAQFTDINQGAYRFPVDINNNARGWDTVPLFRNG